MVINVLNLCIKGKFDVITSIIIMAFPQVKFFQIGEPELSVFLCTLSKIIAPTRKVVIQGQQ